MFILIDNYDSFTYNLYQAIAPFTPNLEVIRNDAKSVEEIEALNPDAIIISPGPGWPKDAGIIIELIKRLSPKIPILGVCLGHQAIAEAFGGKIINAGEIVHGKSVSITHTAKGLFENLPLPMEVGRYHSLVADPDTLPACLTIEATSSSGKIMAIKHKDFPCWGVQFHPESILTPEGPKIIENFIRLSKKYFVLLCAFVPSFASLC